MGCQGCGRKTVAGVKETPPHKPPPPTVDEKLSAYPWRDVLSQERPRCLGRVVRQTLRCGHRIPAEYDPVHGIFVRRSRRRCYLCPKIEENGEDQLDVQSDGQAVG